MDSNSTYRSVFSASAEFFVRHGKCSNNATQAVSGQSFTLDGDGFMENQISTELPETGRNARRPTRTTAVTLKPKKRDKRRNKTSKVQVELKTLALQYQHQLAVNVRILRTWRGWPQQVLGDMLGWSRSTIIRIETGKRCPSFGQVCVLADTLGVSIDELRKDLSDVYSAANAGTLPELLRNARLDQNLSQDAIAAECELSRSAYQDIESGRVNPDADVMQRLASILGRSIGELTPKPKRARKK